MSKGMIPLSILENIAKAIRYVNGLSTKYKPSEMENAIRGLKKSLGQKTITLNGVYSPSADNLDGYSQVTVNVEGGGVLVSKNITQNGTYNPSDDSADGYSSVAVSVPNTYSAADNGKVVSEGSLVPQTNKSIILNGTYDTTLNNSITVNVESGGGGGGNAGIYDVNFYDYDGTLLYSYTATDFLQLSQLPENPSHTGLTAQGWNWTLADAKTFVTTYRKLDIGQTYITNDGKTRLYIELTSGRLKPYLGLCINGTATINWGDGSANSIITGSSLSTVINTQHVYANAGNYVISISVEGSMRLYGTANYSQTLWANSSTANNNKCYLNAIYKAEIGSNVEIGNYAFNNCYNLKTITLPNTITSIGEKSFYYCYTLGFIVFPNSLISIGKQGFGSCQCLVKVSFSNSITTLAMQVFNNAKLNSVVLPSSITTLPGSLFSSCTELKNLIIPDSVTSIGSTAIRYCYALNNIYLSKNITSMADSVFEQCKSLAHITLPNSLTSVMYGQFKTCQTLLSAELPNELTSIGKEFFQDCVSLSTITIPQYVTSIDTNVFSGCVGLGEIHFLPTTPPSATSTSFSGVPTDCIIYVPTGSLSAYTSAANYPSSATYTYIEE